MPTETSTTTLSKIKWSTGIQYFLCGNHEMVATDHKYSSAKVFDLIERGEVLDEPTILSFDNIEIGILPYILESNRKSLTDYLPAKTDKKRLILSHNDIKGIQMGKFVSEAGFSIEELEANADLILNAKGILANTMSGYTARKISYFRPRSIIIGLSPKLSTLRSLTLNYGVLPILVKKFTDTDSIIDESIKEYKKVIPSQENDIVILTGGFPLDNKSTNFMKIEKL